MIIDGHCDALYKMFENPNLDFYHPHTPELDVSYTKMKRSGVKVQFFAIYLPERLAEPQFDHYLEYIRIFYQKLVHSDRFVVIRTAADLDRVMQSDKLGAILTLEGADALQGNPLYTFTLYQLGVRLIGVTWNYANWAADGVLEPRQGGLTRKGKRFIKECNEWGILLDVSHLSVRSFWDLAETSTRPFVATHSNAKAVCPHPRNLDDDQIRELIRRNGRIGITFVPWFVQAKDATIDGILKHIDHICALGGERHVVFGSDFDGIDKWIPGLENAGEYGRLKEALIKHFSDELAESFLFRNWFTFLKSNLPIH